MSAAEKLKALDVKPELISLSAHPDLAALDVVDAKVFAQLFNALPQIVAVVKAAENVTFYGQEEHRFNEWHGSEILLALSALDEALGT